MGVFINFLINYSVESIVSLLTLHNCSNSLTPALFSFLQPLVSVLNSLDIWMVTVDFKTACIVSEAIILPLDILVLIIDYNLRHHARFSLLFSLSSLDGSLNGTLSSICLFLYWLLFRLSSGLWSWWIRMNQLIL